MKSKFLLPLSLLLGILGAVAVPASDPPHWTSANTSVDCSSQCHTLHTAAGGTLTLSATNVNLCQSCHNSSGMASNMPLNNADKANVGYKGTSHAFDVAAVNPAYGAAAPANSEMSKRVMGGNIVCSTCHDQHSANGFSNGTVGTLGTFGGTPHIASASKITALGSTGAVTSGGVFTYTGTNLVGTTAAWYLVEIYGTGGARGTATFHYSKDNGTSWFPAAPGATLTAPTVALDSGVTLSFGAGNYVVGERWQFYGAFPFLRAPIDSGTNASTSKFCRDCHGAWVMDHARAAGDDGAYPGNGTNVFSHPVGVPLNANGGNYDRVGAILDGNGVSQSGGGDGNAFNDLAVDAGGNVQCLTCHAVHFAPSNTSATAP